MFPAFPVFQMFPLLIVHGSSVLHTDGRTLKAAAEILILPLGFCSRLIAPLVDELSLVRFIKGYFFLCLIYYYFIIFSVAWRQDWIAQHSACRLHAQDLCSQEPEEQREGMINFRGTTQKKKKSYSGSMCRCEAD